MTARWNLTITVPPAWTKRDREVADVAADQVFRSGFEEGAKAMLRELSARSQLSLRPDETELVREVVRDQQGRISEVIERKVPRRAR